MVLPAEKFSQGRIGETEQGAAKRHGGLPGEDDFLATAMARQIGYRHGKILGDHFQNALGGQFRSGLVFGQPDMAHEIVVGQFPAGMLAKGVYAQEHAFQTPKFVEPAGQGQDLLPGQEQAHIPVGLFHKRNAHVQIRGLEMDHEPPLQTGAEGGIQKIAGRHAFRAGKHHLLAGDVKGIEQDDKFALQVPGAADIGQFVDKKPVMGLNGGSDFQGGLGRGRIQVLNVADGPEKDGNAFLVFGNGVGHGPEQMGFAGARRAAHQKGIVADLPVLGDLLGQGQGKMVLFVDQEGIEGELVAERKIRRCHRLVQKGRRALRTRAAGAGFVMHQVAGPQKQTDLAFKELLDRGLKPSGKKRVGKQDAYGLFLRVDGHVERIKPTAQILLWTGARKVLPKIVFEHAATGEKKDFGHPVSDSI